MIPANIAICILVLGAICFLGWLLEQFTFHDRNLWWDPRDPNNQVPQKEIGAEMTEWLEE